MTMCIYHCYNYITKHLLEDLTMLEVALKKKKKKILLKQINNNFFNKEHFFFWRNLPVNHKRFHLKSFGLIATCHLGLWERVMRVLGHAPQL